jgi:hypothetical protein
MQTQPLQIRQALGCGFEPSIPGAQPWEPSRSACGTNVEVTTCPGYTTQLPEVFETLRARTHWKNGQLATFCGGAPTENQQLAIEVLDGECARFERWAMTPESEGGGRRDR